MNKTIYMTYKKDVPEFVFSRWKEINPEYNIEFSLDQDCRDFLKDNFNEQLVESYDKISNAAYKTDLWRLCKLYIYGGVYADIDLIPHIDIDTLDKNVTFYSCLSGPIIFQAFIVSFLPKNPLFLNFIISLLLNKPFSYTHPYTPTADMYNCLRHNLNVSNILPETKYEIEEVKICINVGISHSNVKIIDLYYFPSDVEYYIQLLPNPYNEQFTFEIANNKLIVTRIDQHEGWYYNHYVDICIPSKEKLLFFFEKVEGNDPCAHHVLFNNKKILDSRDPIYYYNKGW